MTLSITHGLIAVGIFLVGVFYGFVIQDAVRLKVKNLIGIAFFMGAAVFLIGATV